MERRKITLPLTRELARTLHAGDQVLLTGTIYTSRDAGHKRMCEALAKGEKIPFDPTRRYHLLCRSDSCKTRRSHRFRRPYNQRPYGCLCTDHDVRRRQRNDRKRCPPSGSRRCMKKYDGGDISSPVGRAEHFLQNASKKAGFRIRRPRSRSTPQALCGRHAACSHH